MGTCNNDPIVTAVSLAGSTIVLMGRVYSAADVLLTQTTTASVRVDVYDVTGGGYSAVDSAGEEIEADSEGDYAPYEEPADTEVIYNSLQTDSRWSKDSTGYNFAYKFVPPLRAKTYEVRVTITDTTGDPIVVAYEVRAK